MAAVLASDLLVRVMVDVDADGEGGAEILRVGSENLPLEGVAARDGGVGASHGEDGAEAGVGGTSRANSGRRAGRLGDHAERSALDAATTSLRGDVVVGVADMGHRAEKVLRAAEQQRPDVVEKRRWWGILMRRHPLDRYVFIDEMGANTKMA